MNIIFDSITPVQRARRSDPATSKKAAIRASAFANSHSECILFALEQNGPSTAYRLSMLTGLSVVQIDRRMSELNRANQCEVVLLENGLPKEIDGFRVWRLTSEPT